MNNLKSKTAAAESPDLFVFWGGETLPRRNSKEFYRYVELSQQYLDTETDKAFNKLSRKKLKKY